MSDKTSGPGPVETVRVWDPLLRIFHWALAVLVIVTWILGEWGPAIMTWHMWLGYGVLALLAFRLVWGFVGPESARFSSFAYGPGTILRYVGTMFRREPGLWPGHNPLGGLFVFVILGVVAAQAVSGLFVDPEDYINAGPFADDVGMDAARTALAWHNWLATAVLVLVGVHVAAILFFKYWKREDLIRPMITGKKAVVRKDG